jgi:hypothetical protein
MQLGMIGLGRGVQVEPPQAASPGDFDVVSDNMLDFTSKMET